MNRSRLSSLLHSFSKYSRTRRQWCHGLSGALLLLAAWTCGGKPEPGKTAYVGAPAILAITAQPENQRVAAGQAATFRVAATGMAPLSYQWKKNGTAIAGATSSSCTTAATSAADNGAAFSVTVSNAAGHVDSQTATLTVLPPLGGGPPQPMPIISRGVPAYGSELNPSSANDDSYGSDYDVPPGGWIAYDLGAVPVAQRRNVVLAWYNTGTPRFDNAHPFLPEPTYGLMTAYTIEIHPDTGPALPAEGWEPVLSVTQNDRHSRQHVFDLKGYRWIRLKIEGGDAPSSFNLDVHDARLGTEDSWLFLGDSITQGAMMQNPEIWGSGSGDPNFSGASTFAQLIQAGAPAHFPVQENGGIGGIKASDALPLLDDWLKDFPGRYVGLSYGTNDANSAKDKDADAFYETMKAMALKVIAAGKVPVIPTIPWARDAAYEDHIPAFNAAIARLYQDVPAIVKGPDLHAYFSAHQDRIRGDNLHPTAAGSAAYRKQWAEAMLLAVYGVPPAGPVAAP